MKKYIVTKLILCVCSISFSQTQIIINPAATDNNINTYTNAGNQENHICYINSTVTPRNELLVFLPGSNGKPNGNDYFDQLGANLGYHVVGLMYPNSPAVGELCDTSVIKNSFQNVRLEIIDGLDRTPLVSVNQANSIENRIKKCIQYLNTSYPTQNWGQYLDVSGSIIWNKIVVAGHSQGGGHAAMIGKNHVLARVICLASPKDNYRTPTFTNPQYLGIIAPWINQNNLTPKQNYFTFTHIADATGATQAEQQIIFDSLGLRQIADSVSIDGNLPPYKNSRILMTYLLTANGTTINPHSCVLVDNSVPDIFTTSTNKFLKAWTYMLTAATQTVTGIDEERLVASIQIYPNPFFNKINIVNLKHNESFELTNLFGETIYLGDDISEQDFSNLNKSVYFLKILFPNQSNRTFKLIKQ